MKELNMKLIVNNEEYIVVDENINSSEIAFSTFSGFLAFNGQVTSEMVKLYGDVFTKLIGSKISLIFSISDGLITGVFDHKMNPKKEWDNIIGERLIEYATAELGAIIGFMIAGPVGAIVGAVAGAILGGLNSDDWYNNGEKIINALYNNLKEEFEYSDSYIYGKDTLKEFIITSLEDDSNFTKKIFPKYINYRKIVTVGLSNDKNKTLASFVKHNSTEVKADIKTNNISTAKEYSKIVIDENSKLKKYDINVITTDDNQEYTVMKNETINKIAKDNGISRNEILDYKENSWVKDEDRIQDDIFLIKKEERLKIPVKKDKTVVAPLATYSGESIKDLKKKRASLNTNLQTVNARLHFLDADLSSVNLLKSSYSILRIKGKNEISKTFNILLLLYLIRVLILIKS